MEEQRHAELFRERGRELLKTAPRQGRFEANWLAPGERGLEEAADRCHERRVAARLPASLREGGGRALRGVRTGARRRSGDAQGVRASSRGRGVPHELHAHAARAPGAAPAGAAAVASAGGTALEGVSAPGERARLGAGHADARGPVLRPASAVRAPGEAERAARAAGLLPRARPLPRSTDSTDGDPRHLGALPRLGRGARRGRRARVRRAGGAPQPAQERRRVSARRHRVVPGSRGRAPRRARRRGLLREADAQVRAHPDDGAARLPALVGQLSPGDEERARRQALGQGNDRRRAGRARRPHPVHGAPPRARGGRILRSADPEGRDPHRRRRRRVGDAHARTRLDRRRRQRVARARPRAALPALPGDALLHLHGLPGLPRERGRVQGDGSRLLRKARIRGAAAPGAAAHAGRGLRARPVVFRVSRRRAAQLLRSARGRARAAARSLGAHRSRDAGGDALCRRGEERAGRAGGRARRPGAIASSARRGSRTSAWAAAWP